ncbi:hypothetical protein [Mangrovibacterium sp.]|uniref:hypothetical protein n=1 Tax=Mangrovibacterium sp. TaxID=1961364 RepID=UPI003565C189
MNDYLESLPLLKSLLKWKLHLAIIGVGAILLAVLFSSPLFIEPLFKSQARIYPTNIQAFSEESESEQLLEVISSSDIKRKMIATFNLADRYKIKADDPYAQTHLLRQYNKYVSCTKTRYETVEIRVLDADPMVACAMVDSLIAFYNSKMMELRREKHGQELAGFQNDLLRKQVEMDSLSSRMQVYRRDYGLLDYYSQTQQLTLGYAEVLARGAARSSVDDLQKRLNLLADKGGEFWQMQNEMNDLIGQRDRISKKIEEIYSLINRRDNFALVVEQAFPADKKSFPTRWLIVLVSLLAVEFLAVLVIFFLESFKPQKS